MSVAVKVFDRRTLVFAACAVVACLMAAHFLSIGNPGTQYRLELDGYQACVASLTHVKAPAWLDNIMLVSSDSSDPGTFWQPPCPAVDKPLYESINEHGAQIFVTAAGLLLLMVLYDVCRRREEQ